MFLGIKFVPRSDTIFSILPNLYCTNNKAKVKDFELQSNSNLCQVLGLLDCP